MYAPLITSIAAALLGLFCVIPSGMRHEVTSAAKSTLLTLSHTIQAPITTLNNLWTYQPALEPPPNASWTGDSFSIDDLITIIVGAQTSEERASAGASSSAETGENDTTHTTIFSLNLWHNNTYTPPPAVTFLGLLRSYLWLILGAVSILAHLAVYAWHSGPLHIKLSVERARFDDMSEILRKLLVDRTTQARMMKLLEAEVRELETENEALTLEKDNLQQELTFTCDNHHKLEEEKASLEERNGTLEEQLDIITKGTAAQGKPMEVALEAQEKQWAIRKEDLDTRVADAHDKLGQSQGRMTALAQKMAALETRNGELVDQLQKEAASASKLDELRGALEAKQTELNEAKAALDVQKSQNADLGKNQLTIILENVSKTKDLQTRLEKAAEEKAALSETNASLTQQLKAVKEQLSARLE